MSRSLAMDTIENHNIRSKLIMLSRRQFMNQSAEIFASARPLRACGGRASQGSGPPQRAPSWSFSASAAVMTD